MNSFFRRGLVKILHIGIHGDKLNSSNFGVDHMIDGVPAAAADTDNFNTGECFYVWFYMRHNWFLRRSLPSCVRVPRTATHVLR
jgi:hypothetical protein